MTRKTEYGSPFINTNSGRITDDKLNDYRLQQIIQNYKKIAHKQGIQFKEGYKTNQFPRIAFPVTGLLLAKFYTDAFCSNKYVYLRGFIYLGCFLVGYKLKNSCEGREKLSELTRNFGLYPQEIQFALQNQDARYARMYLDSKFIEEQMADPVKEQQNESE